MMYANRLKREQLSYADRFCGLQCNTEADVWHFLRGRRISISLVLLHNKVKRSFFQLCW